MRLTASDTLLSATIERLKASRGQPVNMPPIAGGAFNVPLPRRAVGHR